MLKCRDNTFYTGLTTNLNRRVQQHTLGVFLNYTKSRRPIKLVYFEIFNDKHVAALREKQIKNYSQKKKGLLISMFTSKIQST
ncbi:MAG TPA: GIY-YIG nuclease family protein [Patescibacteria group bacterium]|nr:GIY-YIG nuclease family protein [Patescibacteria group bacterium]